MDAVDFCNRLIQRKQTQRLGYSSSDEIRNHPWQVNFNFAGQKAKVLNPPFVPLQNNNNFDKNHVLKEDNFINENPSLVRRNSIQALFDGYENNNVKNNLLHMQKLM